MTQQVRTSYRKHRKATWTAVLALIAMALAVGLAGGVGSASGAGSVKKTGSAAFNPSAWQKGATTSTNLTITNDATSPNQLGSAQLCIPAGFGVAGSIGTPSGSPCATARVFQLLNLGIAAGSSKSVGLSVTVPCNAPDSTTWSLYAKQSNDFKGPPGNNFDIYPFPVASTSSGTGCKLLWDPDHMPASAVVNTNVTSSSYDTGASSPAVCVVSGSATDCSAPLSVTGPTVTLAISGTWTGSTGTGFTGLSANLSGGVATFPSLKSDRTGTGFTAVASASGFTSSDASAPPFNISLTGTTCTTNCALDGTQITGSIKVDAAASGPDSFRFLAINNASLPDAVKGPGGGCESYAPVDANGGFEATDGRTSSSGELRFTYYVSKSAIQKLYGNNQGQQFIPICAGGAKLNSDGTVQPCQNGDSTGGWLGKGLTAGKFDGTTKRAVCYNGAYWGILGSFQDYTGTAINGNVDPTVTGWDSNTTYRFFYVRVPSPWDWKMT